MTTGPVNSEPFTETLMRQAGMTAHTWLIQGKKYIDEEFGEGHAKGHPELLAGFMISASNDQIAMYIHKLSESLPDALNVSEAWS